MIVDDSAMEVKNLEVLRGLLELGFESHARVRVEEDGEVYTWGMPLYACVRAGKYEMAEILLERGADPNGKVYARGTPLSEAYGQRDEVMIGLLVRHGGKPNASMAGLYRRMDLWLRNCWQSIATRRCPMTGPVRAGR